MKNLLLFATLILANNIALAQTKEEEQALKQAEMSKAIIDHWNEESAANDTYFASIDNSSVAESIASNPIRTIKENDVEIVIDFSKASKEIINFFLVRHDNYKSTELRKRYLKDFSDTKGEKLACKFFDADRKIWMNVVYEGQIAITESYSSDGSITKGNFKGANRVGIWKTYNKNGEIIDEVDFDEQNKINAFEYFSNH